VLTLIERFNYVSGWVATTLCLTEKLQDRLKSLKKFIDIAVVRSAITTNNIFSLRFFDDICYVSSI